MDGHPLSVTLSVGAALRVGPPDWDCSRPPGSSEQFAAVHEAGCRLVQGYLLGRPVPPDALRERLRQPAGTPLA